MGKVNEESPTSSSTTPICRCRVMYLGSAVPHVTKDGLQGIQEPLRDLYPEQGALASGTSGIDSWLSVWSNGILVENVDNHGREVKRFYPIESLHYCAAVRYVVVPGTTTLNNNHINNSANNNCSPSTSSNEKVAKFLPLDSPFSRHADTSHPPLFACILRRTTGIKVLECHAFICKREAAANALVRCCFHAYADTIHAKQIENENPYSQLEGRRSRSISAIETVEKVEQWQDRLGNQSGNDEEPNGISVSDPQTFNGHVNGNSSRPRTPSATSLISHSPDDENYKVWTGQAPLEREVVYLDGSGTLRSIRSIASTVMRTPKPRQMNIPILPPPPPPLPPLLTLVKCKKSKKKEKESTLKKRHKYKGPIPPASVIANGYPITFLPPPTFQGPIPHPNSIYAPSSSIYSEKKLMKRRPPMPPPPPHLSHLPPELYPPPILLGPGCDEPIYIPAMRPVTPMSNYHPHHHRPPHPLPPLPPHLVDPSMIHYGPPPINYGTNPRSLSYRESVNGTEKTKKSKKKSPENSSEIDSPFNTGIYKKKGHLNERAFSYSIKQEHRSRSNSLSNLQFESNEDANIPLTNGNGNAHIMNGNGNSSSSHSASTPKNGRAPSERELSARLSGLEINGTTNNKQTPKKRMPPPPPRISSKLK